MTSLSIALASLLRQFAYLKYSLIIVLLFVGVKMLIATWVHIPSYASLGVIVGLLGAGILASHLLKTEQDEDIAAEPDSVAKPDATGDPEAVATETGAKDA